MIEVTAMKFWSTTTELFVIRTVPERCLMSAYSWIGTH
jgi:hypothetical protein